MIDHLISLMGFILLLALFFAKYLQSHALVAGRLTQRLVLFVPVLLAGVILLNIVVNPYGHFTVQFFEPIVRGDRNLKLSLYDALPQPPDAVILGSSRVELMPTAPIREACGVGAFNANLPGGYLEDHYAMARYIFENHPPRYLIMGLDEWAFSNASVPGMEMVGTRLYPYAELPPLVQVRNYGTLIYRQLSHRTLLASLRVLGYQFAGGYPAEQVYYDAEGVIRFVGDTGQPAPSNLDDVAEAQLYENFTALEARRVRLFEALLDLAEAHGAAVYVFIPPMHPSRVIAYRDNPYYTGRHQDVLELLARAVEEHPNLTWYDFTSVSSFGGIEDNFYDPSHPQRANAELILKRILQDMCHAL